MGTEKGLPFQLGKQPGQLAVKLDGITVFAVQKYMVTQLLQIEKVGEGDALFHPTLPDSQLWHAVVLQFYQPQEVIYLFLLDWLFQIFQPGKTIAFQSVIGAGGGKGDGDLLVHLPYFLYRLYAGHAVHVNVHQQQVEGVGAKGLQQLLAIAEQCARFHGRVVHQVLSLARQVVADSHPDWFHPTTVE